MEGFGSKRGSYYVYDLIHGKTAWKQTDPGQNLYIYHIHIYIYITDYKTKNKQTQTYTKKSNENVQLLAGKPTLFFLQKITF